MKSEIDVGSEIERQRRLREAEQKDRLLHQINIFLSYCYAVTTPVGRRGGGVIQSRFQFQ